jgi:glycosyltransferase involved in cell wall biosynthesis
MASFMVENPNEGQVLGFGQRHCHPYHEPVPLVSIVIPAYQNARFIDGTMSSALAQTYADLEVVVADHSSTDGTWEKLQAYADDPRVRLAPRTPRGGGAPANWNAVTSLARGTYVKLLCGDDLIAPTCLARQVEELEAHPSAVLAAVRRDLIDPDDRVLLRSRGLGPLTGLVPGDVAVRTLVRTGTNLLGEPGCVLVRREALTAVGGWLGTYPYLIDQFTYMNILGKGELVGIPETLASFRISDTQWSVRLASAQARQAAGAHHHFRAELPDTVGASDVRLGNLRARRTAFARRGAYIVWRRRMRASAQR